MVDLVGSVVPEPTGSSSATMSSLCSSGLLKERSPGTLLGMQILQPTPDPLVRHSDGEAQ